MALDDDHVIENDVVNIGSQLEKDFVQKLKTKVDAATAKVTGKVTLVADATGFKTSADNALKAYAGRTKSPEYKVKLVADTTGFAASVTAALARVSGHDVKVGIDLDAGTLAAKVEAAAKSVGGITVDIDTNFDGADLAAKVQAATAAIGQVNIKIDVDGHHLRDQVKLALLAGEPYSIKVKLDVDSDQLGELESRLRRTGREGSSMWSKVAPPRLINFGGQGIQPYNLLIASLLALSPLLVSVGASALQAAGSLTILGTAGIGAALGITGVTLAFKGIAAALALRKSVRAEEDTAAANADKQAATALKNQRAINDARKQAIQDLETLKQKLIDLQNQEKDDTLSVKEAEAKRDKVLRNYFSTPLERARAIQDVANAKTKLQDTKLTGKHTKQDLGDSLKKGIEGSDKVVNAKAAAAAVTSPAAQLKAMIAKMSPAARDMYNLLDKNQDKFDALQRKVSQKVLPGFTNALRTLLKVDKHGASTLDLFADAAGTLGGKVGKLADKLAKVFRTGWFRKDFKKIVKDNGKAFDLISDAVLTLVKPFMTIFKDSGPLLIRFAGWIKQGAQWFATLVDKADKDGKLQAFLKRSGDEFKRWWDLATAIGGVLKGIFTATAPSGGTVIDRLTGFFTTLGDWANSPAGQKKIKDFFDKIAGLPYKKIAKFLAAVTEMITVGLTAKFVFKNPLWTLLGTLAASNPDATIKIMNTMTDFIITGLGWLEKHPGAAESFIAVLTAYRLAAAVKWLGPLAPIAAVVAVTGVTFELMGKPFQWDPVQDAKDAWKDFKKALQEEMDDPFDLKAEGIIHWFSITLPNSLNLGLGQGGWAGLMNNLGTWFSTTLPNWIFGGTKGWGGAGDWAFGKTKGFGQRIVEGLWQGIKDAASWLGDKVAAWCDEFWAWLKKQFGVASPSTISAEIGGNIIAGLWNGIVDKWNKIKSAATTWIDKYIKDPLVSAFSKMGEAVRNAFVNPFSTLVDALSAPVNKAFAWINAHLITPLNGLLSAIHLPSIPPIQVSGPSAGDILGSTAATAAKAGAALVSRADGGAIPGNSPHSKADNIPAMLTAGEWVHPVDAVRHYGPGFMEAVRTKQFPRYADGGAVGGLKKAAGTNLATEIITAAIGAVSVKDLLANAVGTLFGTYPGSGVGTAIGDAGVSETAESTARAMGATDKQLVALIEAGIVESGLRNLNYGDRDSLGFLQQRPSQGWGQPAQIMNVAYATRKFIEKAKRVDKPAYTAGELAQAVQVSGYPDKYGKVQADAIATLNRAAPFLSGFASPLTGGAGGPLFGAWPSSAASVHGHDSGIWRSIIGLVPAALNTGQYGTLYNDRHTDNGGWSWHASGRAVDFMGYNQDALAQFFEARRPSVLELIHSTDTANYGIQRGQAHDMGHEFGLHKNHLHVAMAEGGQVPVRKYDVGGTLPPGYTMAYNGTGRNETIRTAKQEQALGGPVRLHRADIALLAAHIAGATSPTVHMDGRKVAEITNAYTYLPAGV